MTLTRERHKAAAKPVFTKSRLKIALIWLIPLGALAAAGWFAYVALLERGPEFTVSFQDVDGLKPNNTPVQRHGVPIGEVLSVELSADTKEAVARIRLRRGEEAFARNGALYWIVRPRISTGSISGLETVMSGPYIEATPGSGNVQKEFAGLDGPPVSLGRGIDIVLYAERLEHLEVNSPVYYRGIEVGAVQSVEMKPDGSGVKFHAFIHREFSPLVRADSKFWMVPGLDVKGGIFSGLQVDLPSLRSLLSGGLEFATKDASAPAAVDGSEFPLQDTEEDEWKKWSPKIALLPADTSSDSDPASNSSGHSGNP